VQFIDLLRNLADNLRKEGQTMNAQTRVVRTLAVGFAVLAFVGGGAGPAQATLPSGVTFTVLNRATVPAFDARRLYRQASNDEGHGWHLRRVWKIDLEATRMIDIVTVVFAVQPGGHSGWHTHPGPAVFTVSQGTLTMYEGDDPSCAPQAFPAGTGSIEAETGRHVHLLRNETDSVAETVVTFFVPVGADVRTDLPDPANCPF
jgi:hypothetical protein